MLMLYNVYAPYGPLIGESMTYITVIPCFVLAYCVYIYIL